MIDAAGIIRRLFTLPGGGPEIDLSSMSQEVSRSHISWSNEPLNKAEVSQPMKD